MRNILIVLLVLIAIPILAVAGFVGWYELGIARFARSTPLAGGLTGKWNDMRTRFRHRVAAEFPVGTPVADVIRRLEEQKFQFTTLDGGSFGLPADADRTLLSSLGSQAKMAVRDPNEFPCRIDWIVGWQAARGTIIRTVADFDAACL